MQEEENSYLQEYLGSRFKSQLTKRSELSKSLGLNLSKSKEHDEEIINHIIELESLYPSPSDDWQEEHDWIDDSLDEYIENVQEQQVYQDQGSECWIGY